MPTVEIRGCGKAGTQVFRADSNEELIAKLREAQRHATRKIRELNILLRIVLQMLFDYSGKSAEFIQNEVQRRLKEVND